jgi:hypothetical protein
MSNRFFPNYEKYIITSPFGERASGYHFGIDLVAKSRAGAGVTDFITAHTGGTVESCGYDSRSGNFVRIRVSDSTVMSYCHFRDALNWKKGEKVEKGTVLGYMGSTGNSTGAHLHFGIKVDDKWIDPAPYLDCDYTEKRIPVSGPIYAKTMVPVPTLRIGDKNESVRALQILLLGYGESLPTYGADGSFGKETFDALVSFQLKNGLDPDGVCGEKTWSKLLGV